MWKFLTSSVVLLYFKNRIFVVQVFAGSKPLLDKVLGILVEGLIDILLGLFNEYKDRDLRALDPSGFCQLMLEVSPKISIFFYAFSTHVTS